MTLASIHKRFMATWLIVFRLLYAMYSMCLHAWIFHNLSAITVGAAESWNVGSGGAGMLLQFQWGSSGAGQEHLKWKRNKRHPLATDNIKSGAEKLCMELPHTVYMQSRCCQCQPQCRFFPSVSDTYMYIDQQCMLLHLCTSRFGSRSRLATQIITGYIVAYIYQPFWLQVAQGSHGY